MNVPEFHRYAYGAFKQAVKNGNQIHISQIHPIVKWHFRVPRKSQMNFIQEMIEFGLIKRVDRDNYEIITCPNLEKVYDSNGDPLF